MHRLPCGSLGAIGCISLVLSQLSGCLGGVPLLKEFPEAPIEETDSYVAESRWGREVLQKWDDGVSVVYLREETERVTHLNFWVEHFKFGLPLKPKKERLREERATRRQQEKLKGKKEQSLVRRHKQGPNFAKYEDWLQAYKENPFSGLEKLPLQTVAKERENKETILLLQLEEENRFGSFRMRFHHLRALVTSLHKRLFTAEAPKASAGAGDIMGEISQGSSRPVSPVDAAATAAATEDAKAAAAAAGGAAVAFQIPGLGPSSLNVNWAETGDNLYLSAIKEAPNGDELCRKYQEELREAFDVMDGELALRQASEAHQKMILQQRAAAANAAAVSAQGFVVPQGPAFQAPAPAARSSPGPQ